MSEKKVLPITKSELMKVKEEREFPWYVIQAFNDCLTEAEKKNQKKFNQSEVVDKMLSYITKDDEFITRDQVFKNGYLDVEPLYLKNGIILEYHKVNYYDSGESYFTFEIKK